ncbi:SRPBCC family protein [Brevibacterium aurantiacum]|uniref:ATPase n=1 Tax=Brevibacterium aurantiacum TaxID=273384 RepID=A0A556CMR9_BREAU|nr:SRPBCC family protein [Brevibacterium aurantiacum]TSI18719.1 ATPase [Brevibacterium aurantiacum]
MAPTSQPPQQDQTPPTKQKPESTTDQVYQIFIRATPEEIWNAIIQPEFSAKYFYGSRVETTAESGSPFRYLSPDGESLWGDETVIESDRPFRLVVGWRSLYDTELAAEPTSRVTWEIRRHDDSVSLLTVIHDHLGASPRTAEQVSGPGWMMVLSGLKTVLETGHGLTEPTS